MRVYLVCLATDDYSGDVVESAVFFEMPSVAEIERLIGGTCMPLKPGDDVVRCCHGEHVLTVTVYVDGLPDCSLSESAEAAILEDARANRSSLCSWCGCSEPGDRVPIGAAEIVNGTKVVRYEVRCERHRR